MALKIDATFEDGVFVPANLPGWPIASGFASPSNRPLAPRI